MKKVLIFLCFLIVTSSLTIANKYSDINDFEVLSENTLVDLQDSDENIIMTYNSATNTESNGDSMCQLINESSNMDECCLNGYRLWFTDGPFGFYDCWCNLIQGDAQTVCTCGDLGEG